MSVIRLLGPGEIHFLNHVADDVFDDPILESAAQELLDDMRDRLVVALDNEIVVGL